MRPVALLLSSALLGCTGYHHMRIREAAAEVTGCTPGAFLVTEYPPGEAGWVDYALRGCGRRVACYTRPMEEIQCTETEESRRAYRAAMARIRADVERERAAVASQPAEAAEEQ